MRSNVRTLGIGLVVMALALAFTTAVQADPGSSWSYHNGAGNFSQSNSPGQWVEQTHLGTVYTFTEVLRNPQYVELHDRARGISIRLYDDACYIQHAGTDGRFDLLYRGYWSR